MTAKGQHAGAHHTCVGWAEDDVRFLEQPCWQTALRRKDIWGVYWGHDVSTSVCPSPFPILHRCTAPGAGWPADPSRWPDAKNAPHLDLPWSWAPPRWFRGSSRGHIWVGVQRWVKGKRVHVSSGLGGGELTLGWRSDQPCRSWGAGPSSTPEGLWSSGCSRRCTGRPSHL